MATDLVCGVDAQMIQLLLLLLRKIRCTARGHHVRVRYEFVQVEKNAVVPLSICACEAYLIHPKQKDRNVEYRSTWGTPY